MTRFVQLHFLTAYPPSNPNRDDLGRPKTAIYGGVSAAASVVPVSQARCSNCRTQCENGLKGHMGKRTQRIGDEVRSHLLRPGRRREGGRFRLPGTSPTFSARWTKPQSRRIRPMSESASSHSSPRTSERMAFEWADRMLAGEKKPDNHQATRSAHRGWRRRRRHVRPHARGRRRVQP